MVTASQAEEFLALFATGDVEGAAAMLQRHTDLQREPASQANYSAHPLLHEFVKRNGGHCYKPPHMRIADLLIAENVRSFRDAILNDKVNAVQEHLRSDPKLIHAQFTAGRGIAQAIHHWRSLPVAEVLLEVRVDAGNVAASASDVASADLEVLTTLGESPLTMQLRFGTVEAVRFLLERGANPNHGTGGHMPSASMSERIELLLAYGWDINNGQLLHDTNHGHGARVITWLKYGANPNAKNQRGQTAMHLLAAKGTGRDAIHALHDAGADINAMDNDGNTPLDLAHQASRQTATSALVAIGAKTS